jgi:hypothetical protein
MPESSKDSEINALEVSYLIIYEIAEKLNLRDNLFI